MRALSERQLALLLALTIILSVVGLWAALRTLAPAPVPPATVPVTVTLRIEASGWNVSYAATTTNNTVLGLLLEAGAVQDFPVNYLYWEDLGAAKVNAIGGVPDGAGGLWWQYWVNGVWGQVGADRHILEDGDAVLWRHAVYPPEA